MSVVSVRLCAGRWHKEHEGEGAVAIDVREERRQLEVPELQVGGDLARGLGIGPRVDKTSSSSSASVGGWRRRQTRPIAPKTTSLWAQPEAGPCHLSRLSCLGRAGRLEAPEGRHKDFGLQAPCLRKEGNPPTCEWPVILDN